MFPWGKRSVHCGRLPAETVSSHKIKIILIILYDRLVRMEQSGAIPHVGALVQWLKARGIVIYHLLEKSNAEGKVYITGLIQCKDYVSQDLKHWFREQEYDVIKVEEAKSFTQLIHSLERDHHALLAIRSAMFSYA